MWVSHRRADNFFSVKASNFGTLWSTFLQFLHASEHSINDIRYMRMCMALRRAYGSTNAVYLGVDTKKTRINRYRKYGWSWKKIAQIYGVSTTTVRRWSLA